MNHHQHQLNGLVSLSLPFFPNEKPGQPVALWVYMCRQRSDGCRRHHASFIGHWHLLLQSRMAWCSFSMGALPLGQYNADVYPSMAMHYGFGRLSEMPPGLLIKLNFERSWCSKLSCVRCKSAESSGVRRHQVLSLAGLTFSVLHVASFRLMYLALAPVKGYACLKHAVLSPQTAHSSACRAAYLCYSSPDVARRARERSKCSNTHSSQRLVCRTFCAL